MYSAVPQDKLLVFIILQTFLRFGLGQWTWTSEQLHFGLKGKWFLPRHMQCLFIAKEMCSFKESREIPVYCAFSGKTVSSYLFGKMLAISHLQ